MQVVGEVLEENFLKTAKQSQSLRELKTLKDLSLGPKEKQSQSRNVEVPVLPFLLIEAIRFYNNQDNLSD